jgi:hypothetical protein
LVIEFDQGGAVRVEDAHIKVSAEPTASHGLADLILTSDIEQLRVTATTTDETSSVIAKRTVRTTLHYDGTSYGSNFDRDFWQPASLSGKHAPFTPPVTSEPVER